MTVLSYSYGIIMYHTINTPGYGNNFVDGINETEKHYLKEQMELIDKLASKNKSKIGMITSASNDVSIKFVDQFIHMINNK